MKPTSLSRAVRLCLAGTSLSLVSGTVAFAAVIDDTVKTATKSGAKAVSIANPSHFDGDLRQIKPAKKWLPGDPVKVANPRHVRDIQTILPAVNGVSGQDPLVAKQLAAGKRKAKLSRSAVTQVNIDGLGFNGVNPPDPTGDIGLKYYIQSINGPQGSSVNVYDKTDGSLVAGPLNMASLQTGDCANTMGDPIVLFDEQAKRWLWTEFSTQETKKLCVLVSKTEDPISGGWYAYEFQAPVFPDYPKYSQFGGVYYASANEGNSGVYAFERSKMLKGEPAAMIRQEVPGLAGFGFNSITPIDVDGAQDAPQGTAGLFIRHRDDELHNSGANNAQKDYLELWTLAPDFANPDNSKLEGPFNIEIGEIDSNFNCSGGGFGCLEQKGDSQTLDPLREVVMYKGQYRRFDGHDSIVGNLITKIGENTAAIRWFELRRSGTDDWALHQEGTYTEGDNVSRYMGGVAMDGDGNMALAYMMAGPSKFPSVGYNGRSAGDELGTLTFGEQILVEGTSPIASDRDGDYSHIGIDPVDNCTFWFTAEYGKESGQWGTQISSFKIPSCGDPNPGFTLSASNLSQEVCVKGDMAPIAINASGYNEFNGEIKLEYIDLAEGLSGSFSVDSIKPGSRALANVTVNQGIAPGDYGIEIKGSSGSAKERLINARLKVMDKASEVATTAPDDQAEQVALQPTLSWSNDNRASSYLVEIATDENFNTIVAQGVVSGGDKYRPSSPLAQTTTYYWRVTSANSCGEQTSNVAKFTTKSEKDGAVELVKGVTSDAFAGEMDEMADFYIDVPEGAKDLSFVLSGDNGDADLYIAKDMRPVNGGIVCAGENAGSEESCLIEGDVASGTYFVTVYAYESYTDAKLTATYSGGSLIEGQKPLSMDEEGTLAIQLSDLTVAADNYPTGFTLTVLPGDKYTVSDNSITPVTDFVGELMVKVKVASDSVDSGEYGLKVQVNNINDAPVISATTPAEVAEDQSYTVELSQLTVEDVDSEASTFTVSVEAGDNYTVESGNVVKPAADYNGVLNVQVKVSDGSDSSQGATLPLTVTPVNDAPNAQDDTATVNQDSSNNLLDVLANDTDVDAGDSLSLVEVAYSGQGSASVFDGKISYTPKAGFTGNETFTYSVKDAAGEQKTAQVQVTVKKKSVTPPKNTSSGGGSSSMILLMLPLLAIRRLFKYSV